MSRVSLFSLALLSLLCSLGFSRPAAAQDRPIDLRIAPELALVIAQPAAALSRDALLRDSSIQREKYTQLRIGRAMRTAGIGLMVGGALGVFMGSYRDHLTHGGTTTGLMVAGIGAAFTFAGSLRVGRLDANTREKSRSGWLYPLAVGVVLSGIAASVAASLPERGAFGH